MASIQQLADRALKAAGIPIEGLSFPDPTNKATWVIHFQPDATLAQQDEAATIITNLDVSPAAQVAAGYADEADRETALRAVRATVALAIWHKTGNEPTQAQIDNLMTRWHGYYLDNTLHT